MTYLALLISHDSGLDRIRAQGHTLCHTNRAACPLGPFSFAGLSSAGSAYAVRVEKQPVSPSQTCTVDNASGVVSNTPPSVSVTCKTNGYTVGGTTSGLRGTGLVLQINSGETLAVAANGSFTFPTPISGASQIAALSIDSSTGLGAPAPMRRHRDARRQICVCNPLRSGVYRTVCVGFELGSSNAATRVSASSQPVAQFDHLHPRWKIRLRSGR